MNEIVLRDKIRYTRIVELEEFVFHRRNTCNFSSDSFINDTFSIESETSGNKINLSNRDSGGSNVSKIIPISIFNINIF